jgi:hypothetical protein
MEPIVSLSREYGRALASSLRPLSRKGLVVLALCGAGLAGSSLVLAQGVSDQQIRCMQLQQELAAAQGGGPGRDDVASLDQQIAQQDRVFQGTQAAMEDAGCFKSFFIFGRALVRSPQCLNMNDRVEAARRQLTQLQQQRQTIMGGGGNKRRQAELVQALARGGCSGVAAPRRDNGGLLDIFGNPSPEEQNQTPIYRNIDLNGRYRSVCVRLCDGFFYPIHYSTYGSQLSQDAEECQSNCAAPAELYVYRNPGQEIEQAISLNGSAYMDLPVALKYRKEYVKGCSCKQAEYNPTEIEAANKQADAATGANPTNGKIKPGGKKPTGNSNQASLPPPAPPPTGTPPTNGSPQLNLEITGSNGATNGTPPTPKTGTSPPPPLPPAADNSPPQGNAATSGQSSIAKSKTPAPSAQ